MRKLMVLCILILLSACANSVLQDQSEYPSTDINMLEAMEQNLPVKCVHDQDGRTVTLHMLGPLLRMDSTPGDAHAIYTEDTLYMWVAKQGTAIHRGEIQNLGQMKSQVQIIKDAETQGVKCVRVGANLDLFTPPEDIDFQDLTSVLQHAQELTK